MSSRRGFMLGMGAAALLPSWPARAQGLSSRPVHIILGQTTGTTPDLVARALAPRFREKWNQPFVVENRGGAGGAIGLDAVAKAPPDGHVITVNVNTTVTLPFFFKVDFDLLKSFTPITMVASTPFVLAVHPGVPATNLPEFAAWAKKEGSQLNYGSPGNGTHHHMTMEMFRLRTGLQMTHIPYKGSAPAFGDLMGGQIQAMFAPVAAMLGMAKSGRVRLIGSSTRERSPLAPEIPTLHEQGLKDFHTEAWYSVIGPADMPADIVAKYNTLFREVLAEPETRETANRLGVAMRTSTPEEVTRITREEYEMWAKVIKEAGIKGG
jgi:tripartite-type tricarboxylate transporter receptor subunit TctC